MRFIVLYLLLLLQTTSLLGQSAAPARGVNRAPCTPDKAGDYVYYSNLNTWIPRGGDKPLQHAPLKVVQLNFNIFQRSDGTGNFQDTPEGRAVLLQYITRINEIFSNVIAPSDPVPGTEPLPGNDTRFRFDLGPPGQERIYFYQSDSLYRSHSPLKLLQKVKQADPHRAKQLNILFTEGYYMAKVNKIEITDGGSGYTSPPKVVFSPGGANATAVVENGKVTEIKLNRRGLYYVPEVKVKLAGGGGTGAKAEATLSMGANGFTRSPSYSNFSGDGYIVLLKHTAYTSPTVLAHELGHTLELHHLFEGHYCNSRDKLEDIYADMCPHQNKGWEVDPFAEVGDGVTNNLMMFAPDHFTYLSPMQAGIMHRASALTDTRRYIAEAYSAVPYALAVTETWDFDMRLYQDLLLHKGANLTLSCALTMPLRAKIEVRKGAKLVLDGQVQAFTPEIWKSGIQVKNGGLLELRATTVNDYHITIEKGGTLLVPAEALVTLQNKGSITVKKGGYVCINKTATFTLPPDAPQALNLHRRVRFLANPAVATGAAPYACVNSADEIQITTAGDSYMP
ncbi:M43 family zinc metalloprotease [Pontibacter sp. 13R65]|uniref:M43 family zinc metalloprotease n=1 Tax=Pontibacter sp. 13R65 TaxID=3127458 RepID=UPI00301C0607